MRSLHDWVVSIVSRGTLGRLLLAAAVEGHGFPIAAVRMQAGFCFASAFENGEGEREWVAAFFEHRFYLLRLVRSDLQSICLSCFRWYSAIFRLF